MLTIEQVLAGIRLEPIADGRFSAPNIDYYGSGDNAASAAIADVIFGGQLIAQAVVAASLSDPSKSVKTVTTVFARGGRVSEPVEIVVDQVASGRTFATRTVSMIQSGKTIAESLVLMHADEPDLVRHRQPAPAVDPPDAPRTREQDHGDYMAAFVDGVDLGAATEQGPPDASVWVRFGRAPDEAAGNQALLAMVSLPFLTGIALRPHRGHSYEDAHLSISSAVMSHSITFHEPARVDQWLLLDQTVPYAGRGRCFGRGEVYTQEGAIVASFSQDGMIKALVQPDNAPDGKRL
ncbi:MAG: acyl-CoA thioesterase domain-containing protein [Acidimicrobiales bacterium]